MPSPRLAVVALPPAIHGARDYAELQQLGIDPHTVVDFSTNSNPFGPHPAVLEAVQNAASRSGLARYPDRDCLALRSVISEVDVVPTQNILPGNGVTELIHLIALTFIHSESCNLVISPTFGEYARAIQLMGGNVYEHRPQTHTNLWQDVDEIITIIDRVQPDSIWLCNPNNPTGQYWTSAELAQLYATDPDQKILWVIDEAYRHFVAPASADNTAWAGGPNVIRLRSLTKDYALAGLRLGYIIAAPNLITSLKMAQPPWSVNHLAQIAGVAALQPAVIEWRQQSLTQLHQHATELWAGLDTLRLTVSPTQTTFALFKVGKANEFRRQLLHQGLLVRDCASFGLPDHIRVAAHRPEANRQLLATIEKMV